MITTKIRGYQIDFFPKKHMSTRFSPYLYGRLCINRKNNTEYWYYIPGLLDNTSYFKINSNRIFVKSTDNIDFSMFDKYCESYNIKICDKDSEDIFLRTGRDIVKFKAKERGIKINGL